MKVKKIVLICLLIILIIGIALFLTNTKDTSVEKASDKNNNTMTETTNEISEVEEEQEAPKEPTIRKSAQKAQADMSNILEIKDIFFIEQTNDVYYNMNDYIGKTIKIEGFIYNYKDSNGDTCYCVVRNTPGCCGNDGLAGLDIRYYDEYPEVNTWVEIIGVIGEDYAFEQKIPAIQVTSLKEKEPGVTFVTK